MIFLRSCRNYANFNLQRNASTHTSNPRYFPYGISNFKTIRENNYFYVDKTPFIAEIEPIPTPQFSFLDHLGLENHYF